MRRLISGFLLLLCVIIPASAFSGCASLVTKGNNKPGETVTLTDQAGRTVGIKQPVKKIVSGYYISSSACIALGLAGKLAGIEDKAASRPIYALAAPDLLKLPHMGTAKNFNLEACAALNPDLVILPKQLENSAGVLSQMGIPAIVVNPESYESMLDMVTLIGSATGAQEQARRYVSYCASARDAVDKLTANLTDKPVVYMCGVGSYLTTAPNGMYQAALIDIAGGVNAAKNMNGNSWTQVSYEQLLAMNPEVMVIPSEAGYAKADILSDPQLADLAAVKSGRVYKMPGSFEAWDSPVPSCILGIQWLLSVLHSDVCPPDTVQKDAAAFYKEFYSVQIDTSLITR